jgi:hypothetical protein
MPWGQKLISAGLIVLTLMLGGNWDWIGKLKFEDSPVLLQGTPERERAEDEFLVLKQRIQEGIEKGGVSVKEMLQASWRSDQLKIKLGFMVSYESVWGKDSLIRKSYIERWQPGPDFRGEIRTETARQICAMQAFEDECREAVAERDGENGALGKAYDDGSLGRAFWWAVRTSMKWYWLMTLPFLLIVLLDIRYAGKKLREELMLRPMVFLKATLCGPIGFIVMDNATGKAYRFKKLEREYLSGKEFGYRLNEAERQAILRQVEEPLLAFNEALESFLASGQVLKQSVAVCAMVWVMGILFGFHIRGNADTLQPTIVACVAEAPLVNKITDEEKVASTARWVPLHKEFKVFAILTAPVEETGDVESEEGEFREITQPLQRFSWNAVKPRGPPISALVRKNQTSTTLCLSGLATVTEG